MTKYHHPFSYVAMQELVNCTCVERKLARKLELWSTLLDHDPYEKFWVCVEAPDGLHPR